MKIIITSTQRRTGKDIKQTTRKKKKMKYISKYSV